MHPIILICRAIDDQFIIKEGIDIFNFFYRAEVCCAREQEAVRFKDIFARGKFTLELITGTKCFTRTLINSSL